MSEYRTFRVSATLGDVTLEREVLALSHDHAHSGALDDMQYEIVENSELSQDSEDVWYTRVTDLGSQETHVGSYQVTIEVCAFHCYPET